MRNPALRPHERRPTSVVAHRGPLTFRYGRKLPRARTRDSGRVEAGAASCSRRRISWSMVFAAFAFGRSARRPSGSRNFRSSLIRNIGKCVPNRT